MNRIWKLMSMFVLAATTTARGGEPGRVEHVCTDPSGNLVVERVPTVLLPVEAPAPPARHGSSAGRASEDRPAPSPWTSITHTPPPPPRWTPVGQAAGATMNPAAPARMPEMSPPLPAGGCGHAADYSWLVGTLEFVHVRQRWSLRFAPLDREERHGGSVTLTETGSLSRFRSGQQVRVTGSLVDGEARVPAPAYRLTSIRALAP